MTNEEIKEKYPKVVYVVEVNDKKIYLEQPSRSVISMTLAKVGRDPLGAYEDMLNLIAVKEISDMSILENDDEFISISTQLQNIVEVKKSSMTKL